MTTTERTRMTVEEFVAATEDDPRRSQLVDGEIVVNEPRVAHARLQMRLGFALEAWRRRTTADVMILGPTEVRLTDHDAYGPDIAVCRAGARLTDRERLAELPSICVEIRSPSTWRYDIGRKKAVYEAAGVPELWLVDDVAREVLVFRRSARDVAHFDVALELETTDTLASALLPGFELALAELFGY